MSIKLYGAGPSRWIRPYWTLQELGVPFEAVQVDLRGGGGQKPEFLKLNPFGKVPALADGDVTIFESAAICNYLGEKYPEAGLIPKSGTIDRAYYDQWVSFVISDLEQPLWRITRHMYLYPEQQRSTADIELAKTDFGRMTSVLETQLKGDYLVGNRFTIADIMMAYTLGWSTRFDLLAGRPKLQKYLELHRSRPAFPKQFFV